MKTPTLYHSYLKLVELLDLQKELSSPTHPDELLFIVIHQSHELWFKLVIHEIHRLIDCLDGDDFFQALKILKRVEVIFKSLIGQIEILHTLTPDEFLGYRGLLSPASGFQSYQYRTIEFLCGLKDPKYGEKYGDNPLIYDSLMKALTHQTVWDKVIQWMHRKNFPMPDELLQRRWSDPYVAHPAVLDAIKTVYQNRSQYPDFHFLFEALVELDLTLQLWRTGHLKTAERTIGFKPGTGGSKGIEYLQSLASRKLFPELWEVRSVL